MGFPMGCCSELAVPKLLVYLILALAWLRRLVAWLLTSVGLGDLLDLSSSSSSSTPHAVDSPVPLPLHRLLPISPARLQEALPAVPYREEEEGSCCCGGGKESCAVCLYEFEEGEEVRRLPRCCHVFHTACLDPWVALGRRTCPLCRAPLLQEDEGKEEVVGPTLVDGGYDDGLLELYYDDDDDYGDFDVYPIGGGGGALRFLSAEELLYSATLRNR